MKSNDFMAVYNELKSNKELKDFLVTLQELPANTRGIIADTAAARIREGASFTDAVFCGIQRAGGNA